MNTQIQSTAKPSHFAPSGRPTPAVAVPSWFEANRALVLRLSLIGAVVILVVLAASIWASNQSTAATEAFSNAMDVYETPLAQPGQPTAPGEQTFATLAERGKAANPLFEQVASKYGLFQAGKNALYFAGLTAEDMGDNTKAEADLKKASDANAQGTGALAKMALASLYRKTNRQAQAISIYQGLIAKPTPTVPASEAKLQLAETYEPTQPEQARKLYAEIKDTDKTSAAAQIASQKLGGGPEAGRAAAGPR